MEYSSCGSNAKIPSDLQPVHPEHSIRTNYYRTEENVGSSYCLKCSYKQLLPARKVPIYHSHYSSKEKREELGLVSDTDSYDCDSCKRRHMVKIDDRRKLVVSDSTLHMFFSPDVHMCPIVIHGCPSFRRILG